MKGIRCIIRSIIDHKYMHIIVFPPIIYYILHNKNNYNAWKLLFCVYLMWIIAFTCSHSGNLFTRVAEGLGFDLIKMFITIYVLKKYLF